MNFTPDYVRNVQKFDEFLPVVTCFAQTKHELQWSEKGKLPHPKSLPCSLTMSVADTRIIHSNRLFLDTNLGEWVQWLFVIIQLLFQKIHRWRHSSFLRETQSLFRVKEISTVAHGDCFLAKSSRVAESTQKDTVASLFSSSEWKTFLPELWISSLMLKRMSRC